MQDTHIDVVVELHGDTLHSFADDSCICIALATAAARLKECITHQVRLHLVNDSSQGSSSPLSSVTGRAAIGLEDQLLVHEEVHLPSSPSLQVVFE